MSRAPLACCRTGTRWATLWALIKAARRPRPEILAATKTAGHHMNGVARRIANGGKTPTDMGTAKCDVVIVGAGAGCLSVAASLKARSSDLLIAVIDPADIQYGQPGWTMVGGGTLRLRKLRAPRGR